MNAIEAHNLVKTYSAKGKKSRRIGGLFGRNPLKSGQKGVIRAIDDVSFSVRQGKGYAVIGRNGAGKTTLFRLLSRITAPDAGRISLRGAVATLHEAGAAFHLDLSGRDNIFLYGQMLGFDRMQIEGRFDAITAFAEAEGYLDIPVKYYSSGMYVRLGFAVAVHMPFDILIVDEVLSAADFSFQEKCLSRLAEVRNEGKTILMASHHFQHLRAVCDRGLVLDNGKNVCEGSLEDCERRYLGTGAEKYGKTADGRFSINGVTEDILLYRAEPAVFRVELPENTGEDMRMLIVLSSRSGSALAKMESGYLKVSGASGLQCRIESLSLNEGSYEAEWHLFSGKTELASSGQPLNFRVVEPAGRLEYGKYHAPVELKAKWSVNG